MIEDTTKMMSINAQVKDKVESVYPLSPLQKGMIFHSMLAPKSGAYVLQDVLDFNCDIDIDAFWTAWQQLIERHSIFRSLFMRMETESPLQVVIRDIVLARRFIDMTDKSEQEQQQALRDIQYEQWIEGFDFQKPPLMRVLLIKTGDQAYRMIWSQHHVLTDGWSGPIVWKDWVRLYHAHCRSEALTLGKIPNFQSYIRWLNQQDSQSGLTFWQNYMQGYEVKTALPLVDGQQLKTQMDGDKGQANMIIPKPLEQKLDNYVKSQGITLNILMQGAWAYLLHLYSGQDDIVFGATVSGRPSDIDDVGKIVGPFINTVPIRVVLADDSEINACLKSIYDEQVARTRHEYMSLIDIHQFTEVPRGENLFETLFVFDNYPSDGQSEQENLLSYSQVDGFSYNHYPMTVMVVPRDKLYLSIKYDRSIYPTEVVERLMDQMCLIVEAMADATDGQKFADVCFMPEKQREQIQNWHRSAAKGHSEVAVPFITVFEQHAENTPNAIALVSSEQSYSYAELNSKANQLASYMEQFGIEAGDNVGICVERSDYITLGMLAAHKLGAAYVVIDGEWPMPRMCQVVEGSGVTGIITEQVLLNKVADTDTEAMLVSLDRDWEDIETCDADNLNVNIELNDTAYLIYTSGSTGVPKGVVMSHRALYFYVDGVLPQIDVSQDSEWLAMSTSAADLGYTALYGALYSGGTLRQLPTAYQLDALKMADALAERPVDVLKIVPSHLAALLTVQQPERILPKKCLVTGGDVLSPALIAQIRHLSPDLRIVNHYGPSEACVGVLTCLVDETEAARQSIAIGRPMAHREVYILDRHQRFCAQGVAGEIYLGGEGLADGYHNMPEMTDEKFIIAPWDESLRLYNTGDLGRFREDGQVEFLGRSDYQIKLRGHRIELGEIEKILMRNEHISQVAVLVAGEQLNAFVVTDISPDELDEYAKEQLSEVMQPSRWVKLTHLPLNANGKINRKELEAMDVLSETREVEFIPPRNELEKQLSAIWLELLKLEQVSVHDSFFQSGGNSLLMIRLHSAIVQQLNVNIGLVDLFTYPTISMQAEFLSGHQQKMELEQVSSRVEKRKAAKGKFRKTKRVKSL